MRVRIRKLRVLGVLFGLGILAVISTVFGMMMAVTSDLPSLEEPSGRNSVLTDRNGEPLGMLTGNQKRIFLRSEQIAPVMKQAIIAIEDRRFYTNAGIDVRGIGRALYQDVRAQGAVQGGSTITMQFVKNALAAQDDRTLFNKLREAAIAYEITRKWSKERILRNYLNTIYFGNGAYGIESAARTYFGTNHPGCGEDGNPACAQVLEPAEAAMIAGIVASPSGFDPLSHREAAGKRRALVLQRMVEQGYLTPQQRDEAMLTSLPTSKDIRPPAEDTAYPYFTSWVKQQVVDKLGGGQEGARKAFEGGLTVQTTLDVRLQDAAQQAVDQWLPNKDGPRASLVAIDNNNGDVLAMVGGDDYATRPFNLATQGQRQPGSAFKPFVLAQALSEGVSPDSTWNSQKIDICVTRTKKGKCREYFDVNNYEDAYGGIRTLRTATTYSDNSVYAQLGVRTGTKKIARLARRIGIRTPVSQQLRDDAGRPQAGCDTARHGARLPDVRARRTAHLEHDEPRSRGAQPRRHPCPRRGRHPHDRADGRRQAQADQAARRPEGGGQGGELARAEVVGRRGRLVDAHQRRHAGHGHARADPRRHRRRQDGHDRELRRRLVRRLDPRDHRCGLGRLPGRAQADGDGVQRRAGRRRYLPRGDLAVVRQRRAQVQGVPRRG